MTDVEKHLFDVLGFVVVDDVLSANEVAEINQLIDRQTVDAPRAGAGPFYFGTNNHVDTPAGLLEWGNPFCHLLDHPRVMNMLAWMLGPGLRIEQVSGVHARRGSKGHELHAATNTHYDFRNGRVYSGLTVDAWNLSDGGGECGGFCCIPGSHKVNYTFPIPADEYPYPVPEPIAQSYDNADFVMVPKAKAGSVLIFTEALTHGSVTWKASYERRTLLYRFATGYNTNTVAPPKSVKLTESQRFGFESAGHPGPSSRPRRTPR